MMMTRIIGFVLFVFVQIALISGVPYLQTIQNLSVYVPNDDITLVCCSQYPLSNQIFEFYEEDSMIHSSEQGKNCSSYKFKIRTRQDIGPYYCAYKVQENGTLVQSNMSNPITIPFADTPLPPTIMLVPSLSVYTTKESMHLVCSPPDDAAAKAIQIYRGEKIINEGVSPTHTYELSTSDAATPGTYYCKYWVEINGRSISSSPSGQVTVNVTEVPLAPSLSASPGHSVYIKGEAVALSCSIPPGFTDRQVQFYKNAELLPNTNFQRDTMITATLGASTTAKFTCQYLAEISGRTIASDLSNTVTITTTESPPVPLIALEPLQPVYITGETVSIVCSVPHNIEGNLKSIKFYRSGQNIHTEEACERKCTHILSNPSKELNGDYSCEYLMLKLGRELTAYSQSVQVTFIDIPQTPFIILTPSLPVYITGETVSISCSLPEESTAISIQYFRDNQEIYKPKIPKSMSTYVISNLSMEDTGSYTCQYWIDYFGRHISSNRGLPTSITVEELPQPPSIDLDPMLPVYKSGESIIIKCMPPSQSEVVHIQYFKDGKEFKKSLEKLYEIPGLSTEKKGNYSCGYMFNRYGRQILSKTSRSIWVSVVDIPQAPSIILIPKLPFYITGEAMSMNCSLPEESTAAIIQYFKNNQQIRKSKTPKTMFTYLVSNLSLENTGSYTCQYCLGYSGRVIVSSRSLPISITVEDPPSTPVLNLSPNLEIFVVGESLVLSCHGFVNARHNIYKDGRLLQNDFSHQIQNVQLSHNGSYTCSYNFHKMGRQVESSRSETVNIYVIDPLPAPTLTLGGPVVKVEDGIKVTLNCSAPDDELFRTFYYFSTTEENDETNLTAFSASLQLELESISHISYICEYEQELRGRKIRSRRSQTLYIQLSDDSMLSPPEIAAIIGALSLLLCFTLALWFYMKSKKYNRQNRFRFSWYWKENHSPKISHPLQLFSPVKKTEETNQVVEPQGEGNNVTVSRNPSSLSIFTEKETDAIEKPMNFSTFHYENQSEGDSTCNYSTF